MNSAEKNRIRLKWFNDADERGGIVLCHWCDGPLNLNRSSRDYCTLDHLEEQAIGGSDWEGNLVPAHAKCNEIRSAGKFGSGPQGKQRQVLDVGRIGRRIS